MTMKTKTAVDSLVTLNGRKAVVQLASSCALKNGIRAPECAFERLH